MNAEDLKVSFIGMSGTAGTLLLEQVNVIVGIAVGIATFAYVCAKIYVLLKDRK